MASVKHTRLPLFDIPSHVPSIESQDFTPKSDIEPRTTAFKACTERLYFLLMLSCTSFHLSLSPSLHHFPILSPSHPPSPTLIHLCPSFSLSPSLCPSSIHPLLFLSPPSFPSAVSLSFSLWQIIGLFLPVECVQLLHFQFVVLTIYQELCKILK